MRSRVYFVIGMIVVVGLGIGGCAFRNDQFDATSLSGVWTEVDPIGDGTVSVSSGTVHLAIPSGTNHNNWPNTTPVNRTLRIVQNLSPGDWVAETKILNTDIHAGRFAGLLVEADSNRFFRSDWDGDGDDVRLYVGVWSGGPSFEKKYDRSPGNHAVQWQRIAKVGTTYTVSTSTDGSSWTQRVQFTWTPTPKRIGLNVGNSGTRPAYTARFDYIVNRPGA
jgi:hypothetical protein